jgi:hypothetical protein
VFHWVGQSRTVAILAVEESPTDTSFIPFRHRSVSRDGIAPAARGAVAIVAGLVGRPADIPDIGCMALRAIAGSSSRSVRASFT